MSRTVFCGIVLLFWLSEADMAYAANSVPTETPK